MVDVTYGRYSCVVDRSGSGEVRSIVALDEAGREATIWSWAMHIDGPMPVEALQMWVALRAWAWADTDPPTWISRLSSILANEVKSALRARGISQAELAREAGTTQKHLSQLLTGKSAGSIQMWIKLSDALDKLEAI